MLLQLEEGKIKSGKKHFIGVRRCLETPKHSPPGTDKKLRVKAVFHTLEAPHVGAAADSHIKRAD